VSDWIATDEQGVNFGFRKFTGLVFFPVGFIFLGEIIGSVGQ
jgi:hypothetical protein